MDFGRLITAMVTPFDADLQVDEAQVEKLVNYLIEEQQSDSIVVCGTTGESPTLTDEEKIRLFQLVVKAAYGRCKVIAGTGSNNTAHSIHLTEEAEKCGVDGILLVAPYYNRPTQEGMYQHFKAIADSTSLPIMLYNIPKRTGVHLTVETTVRLAQIPNITSTKEASADLDQMTKIAAMTDDSFKVYSGDDNLALPCLAVGGYGVVSVSGHVVGRQMKQMINNYLSGNVMEASKQHSELLDILTGMFICPNPVPVKYALSLHGVPVGGVRLPLVEANELEKEFIRQLFAV
ncbi:4-hydroxy-tetrahydrodipicolinate synthase [Marinicrinis sediminis]|uniref:4-hydroxy-tetrahydrodipicolinate synthase n=1 Tax=Marinicrinis sediminis TaxID=1652465 RepID=A0ABW5R632_9BACL